MTYRDYISIEKHALTLFTSAFLSPYDELFNIKQNFKMKKYMPLNGLRWSRDSGSALCGTPPTDVLGQAGGVNLLFIDSSKSKDACCRNRRHTNVKTPKTRAQTAGLRVTNRLFATGYM